jgi:hypothetical protein
MKSLTVLVVLVGVLIAQILAASVQDKKTDISSNAKKPNSISNLNKQRPYDHGNHLNANDDNIDRLKSLVAKLKTKKTTKAKRLLDEHECEDKCDGGHPECASWCQVKDKLVHDNKVGEQLRKKIKQNRASVKVASAESKRKSELKSLLEKLRKQNDDVTTDNVNDINGSGGCGDVEFNMLVCTESLVESFSYDEVLYNEIDDSILPQICSALEEANTCLQQAWTCKSSDSDLAQWIEVYQSIQYICTDGRDALAGYQTCLTTNEDDYYNEIINCFGDLPALPDADNDDDDVPNLATVCSFNNGILKCLADAAGDNCNSAQFVANYYINANQPLINYYDPGCTLSYTAKTDNYYLIYLLEQLLAALTGNKRR